MNFEERLEIGLLYRDRAEYQLAIKHLQEAAQGFLKQSYFQKYLKCTYNTIHCYLELENHQEIQVLKEELNFNILKYEIPLTAHVYYTLGITVVYSGKIDLAYEYFKKSLELAIQEKNNEEMCYALLGLCHFYKYKKEYELANKELLHIELLIKSVDNKDLHTNFIITQSTLLMEKSMYKEAYVYLLKAYDLIKEVKQIKTVLIVLGNLGICLTELGQKNQAFIYFNLITKLVPKENCQRILRQIQKHYQLVDTQIEEEIDLMIDFQQHCVKEKKMGLVNFKNQFILLDLLKLLISKPGQAFSKMEIATYLWKVPYNSEQHDNKLYVTIKRLKSLIEPSDDHPKYILRSAKGYFFCDQVKFLERSIKTDLSYGEGA